MILFRLGLEDRGFRLAGEVSQSRAAVSSTPVEALVESLVTFSQAQLFL
jgi:hypothetical protein